MPAAPEPQPHHRHSEFERLAARFGTPLDNGSSGQLAYQTICEQGSREHQDAHPVEQTDPMDCALQWMERRLTGASVTSRATSLETGEGIQGMRGMLALVLVLLVAAGQGTFRLIVMRSWSRVVTYARTGQMPPVWHAEDQIK
jgi:hypothetical protein